MHDIDRSFTEFEQGFEFSDETDGEVLTEGEIEELASEILSISSEAELDQFLGGLIKKAGRALGKGVGSPLGRNIGGLLKGLARKALPAAGAALGNMVMPGVGGMIGSNLASAAGASFGLELEGLSAEDQQFEIAKQFVRLGADATKKALSSGAPPPAAAKEAVASAARKYAPGLLQGQGATSGGGASSGRWVRRGTRIVLYGV